MRSIRGQSSSENFNHSGRVRLHKIPTSLLSEEGVLVIRSITIPGRLIEGEIQLRVLLPHNMSFWVHEDGLGKEISSEFSLPNINAQGDNYTFEGMLAARIVKSNNDNGDIFVYLAGGNPKKKILLDEASKKYAKDNPNEEILNATWEVAYTYIPTVKKTWTCLIL